MNGGDWGHPKRIWGLEQSYDPGRMIEIYLAIKDLPITSILDVACGTGIILDGLAWMRDWRCEQFDIQDYPEWGQLTIKPFKEELECYIRKDHPFDLVMMLNSYRNWDEEPREEFNAWLKRNAKYFITSNVEENGPSGTWKVIGKDARNYELKLYEISTGA